MTSEELKAALEQKLGREITISQVTAAGRKGFMVDYFNYSAPATKLVADTEEEAMRALFSYLCAAPSINETSG